MNSELSKMQLAATSRFFCSAVMLELARRGMSPRLMRLARESVLLNNVSGSRKVRQLFDVAFEVLKARYNRDEYIYKAALTQKVLLGTHSMQTASMLTEFRVANCKADVVILNGTATAYEIKSERDSLARLDRQIEAYRRVFAKVQVIAAEEHVAAIIQRVPDDVGVSRLTGRYRISTVREAQERADRTSPIAIFETLRIAEAKQLLNLLDIHVPSVPNTQMYGILRQSFECLKPRETHCAMVEILKKTRALTSLESFLGRLPISLHAAVLSTPFRLADQARFIRAVNTSIRDAMAWTQHVLPILSW